MNDSQNPATLPVVAEVLPHGATVRLDWASVEAAHNAKPGALTPHAPAQAAIDEMTRELEISRGVGKNLFDASQQLLQENEALRAEVERLRKDAGRYRKLAKCDWEVQIDHDGGDCQFAIFVPFDYQGYDSPELDAAIDSLDAAMSSLPGEGEKT